MNQQIRYYMYTSLRFHCNDNPEKLQVTLVSLPQIKFVSIHFTRLNTLTCVDISHFVVVGKVIFMISILIDFLFVGFAFRLHCFHINIGLTREFIVRQNWKLYRNRSKGHQRMKSLIHIFLLINLLNICLSLPVNEEIFDQNLNVSSVEISARYFGLCKQGCHCLVKKRSA